MHDESTTVRPFREDDTDELWSLKRGFELGLGGSTGGEDKRARYAAKLTDDYREEWLAWVGRCVDEDPDCVQVAAHEEGPIGYAFVLPASLAFIWDAAVLNEVYLDPPARGTGVADDLMEAALDCARAQDLPLDRLVLDVDRENDRARAFYDRWGFEHWGEMVARPL
jgi:GNAT superfamily N-acetyltransferase